MVLPLRLLAIVSSLFSPTRAHPGHSHAEEVAERAAFLSSATYTNLNHCADKLEARSAALIAHRSAVVESLRTKRGITKRSFEEVLNKDHHSNASVTSNSPDDVIFAGNNSCVLQPETTEGPYCTLMPSMSWDCNIVLTARQGFRVN